MPLNFFIADRIKELSRVDDTGNIILDGAVAGFSSFGDFFASGDTVFYAITDNVKYEVGSGQYVPDGSDRVLTRNVFRSSNLNSGPYYVHGSGSAGTGAGQVGHFHPVYLTRSSALSGIGISTGPFGGVTEHSLSGYPGITFYMPADHQGVAESYHAGLSGVNYNASGAPVDFDAGLKEVFATYPGKTAVYNAYGLGSDVKEPKESGLAFWKNEQIINYTSQLVWDDDNNFLGVSQSSPAYAVDVGGDINYSLIRASGFIDGGSGIMFSGVAGSFSGGRQLEPFMRNELDPTTGTNAVFYHSGIVDQRLMFERQIPTTVLMGPSGECDCVDDYPTFRTIRASDLPDLGGEFVVQNNDGADSVSAYPFNFGQVALYKASGEISYDSGILYDTANGRLGLGGSLVGKIAPAYTLDVSGNMAVNSGYFDQIIFDNSLIRIGNNAGSDLGNTSDNYYLVNISDNAGYNASGMFDAVLIGRYAGSNTDTSSGVVAIGFNSLWNATENDNSVFIGDYAGHEASGIRASVVIGSGAGSGLMTDSNSVFLGTHAGAEASGTSNVIAIGHQALQASSGSITSAYAIGYNAGADARTLVNTTLIGDSAGSKAYSIVDSNIIGTNAGDNASGITYSLAVGHQALSYASGVSNSNLIGMSGGKESRALYHTQGLGGLAASQASGSCNIYIGNKAGIAVSGSENIEIIGSGGAASFLTHEASGKINIAKTIVGDMYTGRVAVGIPSDASPSATLEVTTKYADDPGFILKHQGSGSDQPYFALQSGDATTIYQITNSGSVITSGYMTPSGGLNLPSNAPMLNPGVGGYMLWNNAGTLTWNGAGVGGAGSYAGWGLGNDGATDTITDGQLVTISGVSGVETQYDAANNFLRISASGLSGVLQNQISASTYTFNIVASGTDADNNEVMPMLTNSVLVVSGVSGIHADFTNSNDGTNISGIFTIGYDPSTTYSWDIRHARNGAAGISDTITNGQLVTVSGTYGIDAFWYSTDNILKIGAGGLSGVLQGQVDSNFTTWSGVFGDWAANTPGSFSGVSGIAAYASGVVTGFTTAGATSGIIYDGGVYGLDPDGSGTLSRLNIKGDLASSVLPGYTNGAIRINKGNEGDIFGTNQNWNGSVAMGASAGTSNEPGFNASGAVFIGYRAGSGIAGSGGQSTTFSTPILGHRGTCLRLVAIGADAAYRASGLLGGVAIGDGALFGKRMGGDQWGAGGEYCTAVGYRAGYALTDSERVTAIGNMAAHNSRHVSNSQFLGAAGGICYNVFDSTFLGLSAGGYSSGIGGGFFGGYAAGEGAYTTSNTVLIGVSAGRECQNIRESIFVGKRAGMRASGDSIATAVRNSIGIGTQALYYAADFDSVIAIGEFAGERCTGVDHSTFIGGYAGYKRSSESSIIISNRSAVPAAHDCPWTSKDKDYTLDIGNTIQGLMDTKNIHIGAALPDDSSSTITDAALSVTPAADSDMALKLNRHSSQAAGLLKAVSSVGIENNEIINQDGFLRITVATARTGSYPNLLLIDSHGHIIPCREGVIVLKANPGAGVPGSDPVELWVGVDYGVTGPIWKQI
jgi:hypothetical protein